MILFACCVAGMRTEFVGDVFKQGLKVPVPAPHCHPVAWPSHPGSIQKIVIPWLDHGIQVHAN